MDTIKQFVLILSLLTFPFCTLQSQTSDPMIVQSDQEMYDFYIQKHKKLKTTGWILLGGGVIAATVGWSVAYNDLNDAAAVVGAIGTCAALSSIPVFIVSGSKKRKAEAILSTGKIGYSSSYNQNYVSAGIRFRF